MSEDVVGGAPKLARRQRKKEMFAAVNEAATLAAPPGPALEMPPGNTEGPLDVGAGLADGQRAWDAEDAAARIERLGALADQIDATEREVVQLSGKLEHAKRRLRDLRWDLQLRLRAEAGRLKGGR